MRTLASHLGVYQRHQRSFPDLPSLAHPSHSDLSGLGQGLSPGRLGKPPGDAYVHLSSRCLTSVQALCPAFPSPHVQLPRRPPHCVNHTPCWLWLWLCVPSPRRLPASSGPTAHPPLLPHTLPTFLPGPCSAPSLSHTCSPCRWRTRPRVRWFLCPSLGGAGPTWGLTGT